MGVVKGPVQSLAPSLPREKMVRRAMLQDDDACNLPSVTDAADCSTAAMCVVGLADSVG